VGDAVENACQLVLRTQKERAGSPVTQIQQKRYPSQRGCASVVYLSTDEESKVEEEGSLQDWKRVDCTCHYSIQSLPSCHKDTPVFTNVCLVSDAERKVAGRVREAIHYPVLHVDMRHRKSSMQHLSLYCSSLVGSLLRLKSASHSANI